MSEFQYYEFIATERRLTEADQKALRAISSRAEITATSLTNSYSYGDFKGDPDDLVDEYFDAMVYVANWGTHTVRLRAPKSSVNVKEMGYYGAGNGVVVRTTAKHAVVTLSADSEGGGSWVGDDGDGLMNRLAGLRAELMAGDLRPLYLGWLGAVMAGEVDEEEREPEVPPGLRKLSKAQRSLAEFLYVDDELIAAAAKASAVAAPTAKKAPRRSAGELLKAAGFGE